MNPVEMHNAPRRVVADVAKTTLMNGRPNLTITADLNLKGLYVST
nr:hypothetical protein [Geofilum rubicundum]